MERTCLEAGRRKPGRAGKPPMPNKCVSLPAADLDALAACMQTLKQATRHNTCCAEKVASGPKAATYIPGPGAMPNAWSSFACGARKPATAVSTAGGS